MKQGKTVVETLSLCQFAYYTVYVNITQTFDFRPENICAVTQTRVNREVSRAAGAVCAMHF